MASEQYIPSLTEAGLVEDGAALVGWGEPECDEFGNADAAQLVKQGGNLVHCYIMVASRLLSDV